MLNVIIKLNTMKKNQIAYEAFNNSVSLTTNELMLINGGAEKAHAETSFWYDISFFAARTGKCIWLFAKGAVEYQHSLPANLKK